ncbi:YcaO-like family protein [Abyssisolibacter fermentans]|uniref:YcaO-like family protein n=1 Tax=Abyssisolibacter fermentans TaxID=1766203 RepID=UPI000836E012|nr:YcaO-like family protein [Abyssisolibacter fermentans]
MDTFSNRKYKDALPIKTITNIRNILSDLGILAVEIGWQNSAENFYSINLEITNTNIGTNGKGTSYQYALASAYGELMERLQNQSFFRLNADLSKEALEYQGFYYAPDEKFFKLQDLLDSDEDWIKKQLSSINTDSDKKQLLEKWQLVSYEKIPSDFISLPYLNINNNKLSYIPIKMISKMYVSNGMCGGNTEEEALVQGLSEVFERHVNKEIIQNKITPPTIPRNYLDNYPRIKAMISQLESSGNYEIIVKDCSLEKGYPVIGVIYINKDDQTYFIKFGAHPMFEVAIERTLTELLQGQDIKNMKGVKEYAYKPNIYNEKNNIMGILVNGCGFYPAEMFDTKFSYEFCEFKNFNVSNNKELLNYLTNLLISEGYDIFIRNVSFLGFPSFHIIVPGFSEIEEFDDIDAIDSYSKYNRIKKYIRNLENISDIEIEAIINFFETVNYNKDASITQFLNLPVKNIFPWYYAKIDLFITALCYKIGDFKSAHKTINKFIDHMQQNSYNKLEKTYYRCARDYIGTKIDDIDEQDAIKILRIFYPLPIINGVITDFGNQEQILKQYGQMNCWDCKKCKLKNNCLYSSTEKIYKLVKEQYSLNPINQLFGEYI